MAVARAVSAAGLASLLCSSRVPVCHSELGPRAAIRRGYGRDPTTAVASGSATSRRRPGLGCHRSADRPDARQPPRRPVAHRTRHRPAAEVTPGRSTLCSPGQPLRLVGQVTNIGDIHWRNAKVYLDIEAEPATTKAAWSDQHVRRPVRHSDHRDRALRRDRKHAAGDAQSFEIGSVQRPADQRRPRRLPGGVESAGGDAGRPRPGR